MSGRKTDYFGNFLDALSSSGAAGPRGPRAVPEGLADLLSQVQAAVEKAVGGPIAPTGQPARGVISLDALVRVWPSEPDSRLSVVQVADTFGASLDTAATVLKRAETLGLLRNQAGMFLLTEAGREAADRDAG